MPNKKPEFLRLHVEGTPFEAAMEAGSRGIFVVLGDYYPLTHETSLYCHLSYYPQCAEWSREEYHLEDGYSARKLVSICLTALLPVGKEFPQPCEALSDSKISCSKS